ncbi:MAG TPA: glycosyltransferase family A protein [Blastocatellia bacterium]|nr:glycosyltransferase family A protein [Blastocatellia bacterium]
MPQEYDIAVIITSYNRSGMLAAAVESALSQESQGVRYEVIVVDNNSTDGTREVVEGYIAKGHSNLRYLFEQRQGVSFARNAGLAAARSPVIAFADDDVRVTRDWVANIKREFDQHPEIDFLGGKILPRWNTAPPTWLTRDHWWALALLDCGDEPFYVSADNPLCLPTANASFRYDVFERLGRFSPDFSGREDHEFLLRLWRAGRRGLYAPSIVVMADVQPERLTRGYHRRWNTTTGRFNSLMRLNENMGPDGRIVGEPPDVVALFGVPGFVYRDLISNSLGWLSSTLRRRRDAALHCENYVWYLMGYISMRYEQNRAQRKHSGLAEVAAFAKALLRKKLHRGGREPEAVTDRS